MDQPLGAGTDLDAFDRKGGIERAGRGISHGDGGVLLGAGGVGFFNRRTFGVKEGRKFTGEAGVRKEIRTIGSDFDFDESVGIEEVFHESANGGVAFENEKSVFFVG